MSGHIELSIDASIRNAEYIASLKAEIAQLEVEMREMAEAKVKPCTWTVDYDAGEPIKWDTSCGEAWNWYEGGLAANHVRYCHGCGGPVVEVDEPPNWGEDDEEAE